MTPKQVERIKEKIKRLKAGLAQDKKHWGGYYHDGRGLRYLIPRLFIQIEDYKGAQRYFNWFQKNFPNDAGFPDFLFEWTIVLFMNGKKSEAEKKLFETFSRNSYIIDKFSGKEIIRIDKWEGSNIETPEFTNYFFYSDQDKKLDKFSEWLKAFVETERFRSAADNFLETGIKLKSESDYEIRSHLVEYQNQIIDNF